MDLFAGIGGFALAARMSGVPIEKHYFSEIEPYAISVYQKNFPEAEPLGDIRSIKPSELPRGRWLITGGFPCQDISVAGKQRGLEGSRSNLWWEFHRLIDGLRPEYAIIENVPALTSSGLDRVLLSLAEVGYDAEWSTICASEFGTPHIRERLWIVAYPQAVRCGTVERNVEEAESGRDLGDGREPYGKTSRHSISFDRERAETERSFHGEPLVIRGDDGLSNRLDRIRGLGNAIVPHVAAEILDRLGLGV